MWLELVVVLHDVLDELNVIVREVLQMREVDVHGHLLVLAHILSLHLVIEDRLTFLQLVETSGVRIVVGVLGFQLESKKGVRKKFSLTFRGS